MSHQFFVNVDQAEQFVKNSEKCDSLEETAVLRQDNNFPVLDFTETEPLVDSVNSSEEFPLISNAQICEEIESKPTSQDASPSEQANNFECPTPNEIIATLSTDDTCIEHSNLNELLLNLNEALDGIHTGGELASLIIPPSAESSTLLDQSFTEDVVTQPMISEIIQNGAFNPSHPDTLTDDELESYLAELEKEDEGETSQLAQTVNVDDNTNDTPSCSLETEEEAVRDRDQDADDKMISMTDIVNIEEATILPLIEEGESLSVPDSDITSAEESNESSFSDSDTGESQCQLQEDSASAEEEMPQLIDDPSLINGTNLAETVPTQMTNEEVLHSEEAGVEVNEDAPKSESHENVSETVVETQAEAVGIPEDIDVSSAVVGCIPVNDSLLEPYSSLTEDERLLGVLKPIWIPDEEAPQCMNCNQRFTVIRRRHHCRACGRVLCSNCCSSRARLEYMETRESRVCLPCLQVLRKVEAYKTWGSVAEGQASTNTVDSGSQSSIDSTPVSSPSPHLPNPVVRVNVNNPAEYCSTVPPALQIAAAAALPTPTVMVPVGVLKKEGTPTHPRTKSEPKQVGGFD